MRYIYIYRKIVIQHQRCVLIYSMWSYKGFHYTYMGEKRYPSTCGWVYIFQRESFLSMWIYKGFHYIGERCPFCLVA